MRVLIVGNHEPVISKIAASARRIGYECADADFVSYSAAPEAASSARRDLLVMVLAGDLDRAIDALRNLRNTVQTPIIVVGEANDPKLILRAMREGATAYVDQTNVDVELESTIHSVRAKHAGDTPGGMVIGVLGVCGGCGASTLAANLATALAQLHGKAAVADLRNFGGDQPLLFDLEPHHTLSDLSRNASRLDRSMFLQSLAQHPSGVAVLAAPRNDSEATSVTPEFVRQAISMARAAFPYVVVDLDRSFNSIQRAAIVQADSIMVTMRLDMPALEKTRRVFDQLSAMGVDDRTVELVVNRHGQRKELPLRKAETVLGVDVFHTVPDDPASMNASINKGVPAVVELPRSKVAKSIMHLAKAMPAPETPLPTRASESASPLKKLQGVAAQYM